MNFSSTKDSLCRTIARWRFVSLRNRTLVLLAGLAPVVASSPGLAVELPFDAITSLGFRDADHTASDGYQLSLHDAASDNGWVVGYSFAFPSTDLNPANTAWLARADVPTRRVGIYDALHTREDGVYLNWAVDVNREGVSVGYASRFDGMTYMGLSGWASDRWGNVVKLGFYDAAHTTSAGGKFSVALQGNERNQVMGYSLNEESRQKTAWLATSTGSIRRLGLFDAAHTAANGITSGEARWLNNAGFVAGESGHFVPGTGINTGSTPWLYTPWGATRVVGFQSGVHQSAAGQHLGSVSFLTESGFLGGRSRRYVSGTEEANGQTAWLTHVAGPNRPVGYYSGIHVSASGLAHSEIRGVNERGYAIGSSQQYAPGAVAGAIGNGATAWIARPDGTMVRVGLYDAERSRGGFQSNHTVAINDEDSLIGGAQRFAGNGTFLGTDGWVGNIRGQTTLIGLTDPVHTGPGGFRRNTAELINNTGWVVGSSIRYHGGTAERGTTAWLYHRGTRTYVPFVLSVREADGWANSEILRLHDDGSVAGAYGLYAGDGTYLGQRAFIYTPEHGVIDLTEAFEGAMESLEWDFLEFPFLTNGVGYIVGRALRLSDTTGVVDTTGVFLVH